MIIALATFTRITPPVPEPATDSTTARVSGTTRAIRLQALTLGRLAFVIFLAEGAVMDWAAVYLVRILGTSESLGATGYAVFSGTMLLGRLLGTGQTASWARRGCSASARWP